MTLPKDWKYVEIEAVASINRRTLSSTTKPDRRFHYLEISSVNKGRVDYPEQTITFKEAPSRARRLVQNGDVLMSMVRPNLQGFAHLRSGREDIVASTGFAVITVDGADSAFIYQSLYSPKVVAQLAGLLVGSGYPAINSSDVEKLVIAIPHKIPEQRKIAAILSTWDEALEKLDALITAKERRKKALMRRLLTGGKRLNRHSTKSWVLMRFEDLLRMEDRYVEFDDEYLYRLVSIRRRSGGVFFREAIKGSNIKTKVMKKVHSGDFLISRMQVVHGALGMVHENCDGFYASDSYEVLVAKDPTKLHMPFLDWMSRQRSFWYLTYICSHGVHIEKMTFNLEDFMRERINIPTDIEEQRQIAAVLDDCDQELRILCAQRAALDQQKRGLMQRLLTGAIRVRLEKI